MLKERQRVALSQADFHVLIDEHAPALYRLAYRLVGDGHEAEDIVQETLRSAWTSRERFDSEYQGAGTNRLKFSAARSRTLGSGSTQGSRAWLASILRRRVVDRWRKVARVPHPMGDDTPEVIAPAVDPLADEFTDEMQYALSQLTYELRESLLLVIVGGLTHQETADSLGVPLGTVLSRVSRARRRLRQHFLAAAER